MGRAQDAVANVRTVDRRSSPLQARPFHGIYFNVPFNPAVSHVHWTTGRRDESGQRDWTGAPTQNEFEICQIRREESIGVLHAVAADLFQFDGGGAEVRPSLPKVIITGP
jgi:hypothetical protein